MQPSPLASVAAPDPLVEFVAYGSLGAAVVIAAAAAWSLRLAPPSGKRLRARLLLASGLLALTGLAFAAYDFAQTHSPEALLISQGGHRAKLCLFFAVTAAAVVAIAHRLAARLHGGARAA